MGEGPAAGPWSPALTVLLEFTASWCPPCRMLEPVLREIAAEEADGFAAR